MGDGGPLFSHLIFLAKLVLWDSGATQKIKKNYVDVIVKEPKTIFGINKVRVASNLQMQYKTMFYICIGIRQEVFQDILIDALAVVVTSVSCHACGGSSYDVFPILIKKVSLYGSYYHQPRGGEGDTSDLVF